MGRRAEFREVLAIREFRALWFAELLSVCGDQLARVGLAVLVYAQTSSATWTALTYALTFLPALVGGVLLGGLADRYPRRELMVCVEVVRAVLAGLMAIPALPLPVLLVLVFLLTLGGAPFKAAQQALLPTVLHGDRYVAGLALRTVTGQSAQLAGFLGGGALVAVLDAHATLALNGGTFLLSGLVIAAGVRRRPAARAPHDARSTGAAKLIWRDPRLRGLVALSWLVGLFVVPEGLAAPYAAGLGVAAAAVGMLMAADPVGSIVGAWVVAGIPEGRRDTATTVFAVAAGVPLALCVFGPPLGLVLLLWAISGACATAYLVLAQASFVVDVPDHHRGAAAGLAGAGVLSSQGIAVLGAGVLADLTSPVVAVAAGGVAGVLLTGLVGTSRLRAARARRVAFARPGGRTRRRRRDTTIRLPVLVRHGGFLLPWRSPPSTASEQSADSVRSPLRTHGWCRPPTVSRAETAMAEPRKTGQASPVLVRHHWHLLPGRPPPSTAIRVLIRWFSPDRPNQHPFRLISGPGAPARWALWREPRGVLSLILVRGGRGGRGRRYSLAWRQVDRADGPDRRSASSSGPGTGDGRADPACGAGAAAVQRHARTST